MPKFPEPTYNAGRRFWRLSDLIAYESALVGRPAPAPLQAVEERFLSAAQVKARYGGVSDMWLHRRLHPKAPLGAEAA